MSLIIQLCPTRLLWHPGWKSPWQRVATPWLGRAFGDHGDTAEPPQGDLLGAAPGAPGTKPLLVLDPAPNIPTSLLSAMTAVHIVILQEVNSPVWKRGMWSQSLVSPSAHISRCRDKHDDLLLKMPFSSVFQRQLTTKKHPKDRRINWYLRPSYWKTKYTTFQVIFLFIISGLFVFTTNSKNRRIVRINAGKKPHSLPFTKDSSTHIWFRAIWINDKMKINPDIPLLIFWLKWPV